ncbi:spore protease YyaC [Thalassobacillus sp. CUG 92003]|uniref:spore protease YyaC n=1 Tax=Thalassobacillus sp. CUG 92003 TaxID=2736641 RepID=UPI0015E67C38|nr:spore protease YyaC [Thalassobacillus sp. CUG 92003]
MNLKDKNSEKDTYYQASDSEMSTTFAHDLFRMLPAYKPVVVLCIGTDRSTGDAFGPLIGSMLSDQTLNSLQVYGTLEQPLHALNLEETMAELHQHGRRPFIVAIDASLGKAQSIGKIALGKGPLSPGAALKKELPEVGNLHISGIVNVSGFMEYFVLQNTRLHTVFQMAAGTAAALKQTDTLLTNKKAAAASLYETSAAKTKS